MTRILKIALIYFGMVFGVGFALGMIRVPFLVPALGERIAEMIELPFMLAAIFLSARWITRRYGLKGDLLAALVIGTLAAFVLLLVEFSVVLWIRGIPIGEFLANRDPIAAILYYFAVGIFALMPAALAVGNRKPAD